MICVFGLLFLFCSSALGQADHAEEWNLGHDSVRFAQALPSAQSAALRSPDRLPTALYRTVSLRLEGATLEQALRRIAAQADLELVYGSRTVAVEKRLTLDLHRMAAYEALQDVLEGTGLRLMALRGGQIVIYERAASQEAKPHPARLELAGAVTPLRKLVPKKLGRLHVPVQTGTIAGTVTDSTTGATIPGVNVVIAGTQQGAATDAEGHFRITGVEAGTYTLQVSFIGYKTKIVEGVEVVDGETTQVDIALQPGMLALDDVVVTALGIEREKRSVGYSVTEVEPDDLVLGTEGNLANLLQGKVAGVTITPTGGGLGSSSRVVIRGVTSLSGDNQPLYVVDGIPINNSNPQLGFVGKAGMWGGSDGGDGIQRINPAIIESISVLKGATASALYGSAAKNGVVLITTKSGNPGDVRVNFTNSTTFNVPRLNQLDTQTKYGQGRNGVRPQSRSAAWATNDVSWGARFDGQPTIQYDGVERPYENVYGDRGPRSAFYRIGTSMRNTLSVTGGSEAASYFLSASNLSNTGIIPGIRLNRTSVTVRATGTIGRLTADVKANYIDGYISNRSGVSDKPENPNHSAMVLARNIPMSVVKNNQYNEDGTAMGLVKNDPYTENPYWIINEMINQDDRNSLIGHIKLDFRLMDWLFLRARTGLDYYTLRRTSWDSWGRTYTPQGTFYDADRRVFERNTDVMLTANRDITSFLSVDAMVGGNVRHLKSETIGMAGSDYISPELDVISNMANKSTIYGFWEKEIRSAYGSASFNLKDYLYLNLTGRNDWSSTLPEANNSYFYPSISGSFVFSSAFASVVPDWLSFGKLRASWAQVGSDTDPYALYLNYSIAGEQFNGQSYGSIAGGTVPQSDLKPTKTQETELGADIRFFDDRLGFDVAWYTRQTRNQILAANISGTSGFSSRLINIGRIDNAGWELQVTGVPVSQPDFLWRTTLNYSRHKSVVKKLLEESQILYLATSRPQIAWITAEVGEEFGTIRGTTYLRDENGNIIHENGLPVQGPREILGRGTPSWTAGWSNTLSYNNFSLNTLIDVQWGGQIFSGTNAVYYAKGLHKKTLEGRAACAEVSTSTGWPSDGCYVYDGVDVDGGPNTTAVTPSQYFSSIAAYGGGIGEEFVYDNNVIYVRQIRLGYTIPNGFVSQFGLKQASISLIARNPFILYSSVPNIDPTLSLNRGNAQGLELAGVPNIRSFGFNVELQF